MDIKQKYKIRLITRIEYPPNNKYQSINQVHKILTQQSNKNKYLSSVLRKLVR